MQSPALAEWENFYVMTGSAAAGLMGLTFVVIALAGDARQVKLSGLRAFVTPTIVHFGAVLAMAAFLSMPRQSVLTLSLGFGAEGLAGLAYVGGVTAGIRRLLSDYVPEREDWIWNVILPAVMYGALLGCACLVWRRPEASLYGVAAVCVLLLFTGIHNAWDIAVWNVARRKEGPPT
jgi:hypothetical protein